MDYNSAPNGFNPVSLMSCSMVVLSTILTKFHAAG
jgi:hypothetical protein